MSTRREFLTLVSIGLVLTACSFGESANVRNLKKLHAYIKQNFASIHAPASSLEGFDATPSIIRLAAKMAEIQNPTMEQFRQLLANAVSEDSRQGRFFSQGKIMITQTEALIWAVTSGHMNESYFKARS